MTKCKKCKKQMKTDTENKRYICECGYYIKWVTEKKQTKLCSLYL